jgi:hypothetical protein
MRALTNIGNYPQGFVRWSAVEVERHALTPGWTGGDERRIGMDSELAEPRRSWSGRCTAFCRVGE